MKNWRRLRVRLGVAFQKRWLKLRRVWPQILQTIKTYGNRKYWPIYLLLFAIGFYFYGPAAGLRQIRSLGARSTAQLASRDKPAQLETLQKELARLKAKLRQEETVPKQPTFHPEDLNRPVLGRLMNGFEWVRVDHTWRLHSGVDIAVAPNENIMAAAAGTVRQVSETGNGTYQVRLDHGDQWETVYGNLAAATVREGQQIMKGVIIGKSGAAGCAPGQPGVHFGIYHNGQPVNPQLVIKGL